jgi:sorting nexin-1/2
VAQQKAYTFNFDCPYPDIENSESKFSVSNPLKTGFVSYTVVGEDKDGIFESTRRYRDFHHVRQALVSRWPGTFVPPIPPKQSVGNKKDKFVENRMYFLDRFLKKIGEYPHLINSNEFRCFSRPAGDVQASLNILSPMTPQLLKERLETELKISPGIEEFVVKESREAVNEFGAFIKKILPTLKAIREQAEKMVNVKEATNNITKAAVDVMSFYESNGLSKFTDQNATKMVIENPDDTELKDKVEGMTCTLANTFKDFYHWIRGELGDVEAAQEAIAGKNRIFQIKLNLEKKKKSEQSELDSLSAGK